MAKLDIVFQKDVIKLMITSKSDLNKFVNVLEPNMFSSSAYRFLFKEIRNVYINHNGETLSLKYALLMINKIEDEAMRSSFQRKTISIFKSKKKVPQSVADEIYKWAEKQTLRITLDKAITYLADNNIEKCKGEITNTIILKNQSLSSQFTISDFFNEWKQRQKTRKEISQQDIQYLQTNLGIFSEKIKIPKGVSLLAILAGHTGVGKSISLINFGTYSLFSKLRVAHFVFENTMMQTLDRYDSRILKMGYDRIKLFEMSKHEKKIANKRMKKLNRKMKNNLKIFHAPLETVSVIDIESALRQLEISENWKPDIILYDSPDHMLPSTKQGSFRLDVRKTYIDVKRQSEIRNIPIFATVHAPAASKGQKFQQERGVSESYDKARLSDLVILMRQTREQEDSRLAEWWVDKWRDGESKFGILVSYIFSRMYVQYMGRSDIEINVEEDENNESAFEGGE